jgi:hypothetical protein
MPALTPLVSCADAGWPESATEMPRVDATKLTFPIMTYLPFSLVRRRLRNAAASLFRLHRSLFATAMRNLVSRESGVSDSVHIASDIQRGIDKA